MKYHTDRKVKGYVDEESAIDEAFSRAENVGRMRERFRYISGKVREYAHMPDDSHSDRTDNGEDYAVK